MIYEQFKERREDGFLPDGTRLWCYTLQFRNILTQPSAHTPPTEVEINSRINGFPKVSARTGRTLHSNVYVIVAGYDDRVRYRPESDYLFNSFETKEECLTDYRACLDFWKAIADQRQENVMREFDQQREKIEAYFDKVR